MRLNKFLSQAGIASRRKSDELIQMATTEVNGIICNDPAYNVKESDIVKYDGKKITPIKNKIVILLHKPNKVITTVKDTHGRKTVMEYVPQGVKLAPIGRLDKDTTGLLLLTNDGDLHQYLTHPKNQVLKDYEIIIEGRISKSQIQKLGRGIYIGDREYGKAEIIEQKTKKGRSSVILRLRQGKKREIRRIMFRLKIKLFSLIKKLSSLAANSIRNLFTNDGINDTGCPLKVIKTDYAKRIPMFKGLHRFLPAMVLLQKGNIIEIPIQHFPRIAGKAKFGLFNRILGPLSDCFAFIWMKRKYINYQIENND